MGRRTSLALTLAALVLISARGSAGAQPQGQVTYAMHVTIAAAWFDPADNTGIATPFMVQEAIHDAVAKPMPGNPMAPSLAESWTVSKDGLVYEFVLRRNVRFHNGDVLHADDVKFSFERYKGASASLLKQRVAAVEVVDPLRVRFRLKEAWPDFLTFYATPATGAGWVVPKKYVEKVGEEGFLKAPVGAGPYKFVSFNPGVELVVEAFEQYWKKVPSVKRLVFKVVPDESTRLAMLKRGEADIVYSIRGALAEELRRTPGLALKPAVIQGTFWLAFVDQWDPKSPWHDRRVRLAANHAMDRNAINQAETLGFSKITGSIIPSSFEFYKALPLHAYDPQKARQLLTEAGFPNGFDAGDFYPWPPYFSMGEALAGYLQNVGIKTRIKTMERAAMTAAWRERKLKNVIIGITGANGKTTTTALTGLEAYVSKSGIYTVGISPDVEDLFQRQARETDAKKREAMLQQIQTMLHERVTHVPIYELAFIWGVGPRVEEPGVNLIRSFAYSGPLEDVKLKKP